MEKIKRIYYKIKSTCDLPVVSIGYIIIKKNIYECGNTLCINLRDDENSLKDMGKISSEDGFYAFVHSKKGKKFIENNKQSLTQAYKNMVLKNAGLGVKICKN